MTDRRDPRESSHATDAAAQQRAAEDRELRALYVSIRAHLGRVGVLLDRFARIVVARSDLELEEPGPPSTSFGSGAYPPAAAPTAPPAPRSPADHRTVAVPAFGRAQFVDLVSARWEAASTEDERTAVLDLLRRGREQNLINAEEHASIEERLTAPG